MVANKASFATLSRCTARSLGMVGTAVAQDKKPIELRYTTGAPPKGN